ncbi:MAG: tRNA (N6-threonylcarbamoyladenosine(37)-N6)-methyltransferase TrmO [Prevotellaceae bacterium]|nr:tRNA (N6-threonylcarbamoyladenosine(37)-N6)-methyltransferase TrmO [Prevotellaceae bacterium]
MELTPIAHIETDFLTKFGIPRQSGLVKGLRGRVIFEKEYRDPEALRGLEGFSHIWLLWDFSEARREGGKWQPTVRPPRLGGNRRMGVWATRSPFRPNNIGLSSVRITAIRLHTPDGPVIEVEGADMMNGTPIFDIKPYLPFTDCRPDATGGFAEEKNRVTEPLRVNLSDELQAAFDEGRLEALRGILSADPRPHYHSDASRVYALEFAGKEVKFRVAGNEVQAWISGAC